MFIVCSLQIHDDLVSELGNDSVHVGLSIACFLASKGAELKATNHHCKLAQDITPDQKAVEILKKYARYVHNCFLRLHFHHVNWKLTSYMIYITIRCLCSKFDQHFLTLICY